MYVLCDQKLGEYVGTFDDVFVRAVNDVEDAEAFLEELNKKSVQWANSLTVVLYTTVDIANRFDKFDDEFLEFDRIEDKFHNRADIHAFLLLHQLVPSTRDIITGADHDVIYLETQAEALNAVATDEQIRDLVRCGVRYNDGHLEMYV